MYETLTAQQLLVGASSEAIQSMLVDAIKEFDPNRVGACTEVLLQRGHSLNVLKSLAKSGPIFLPAASVRCLIGCLQRVSDLREITQVLSCAFGHIDERLSADFNFETDFLSPLEYLCTRRYFSLDFEEFCKVYKTSVKGDPKTPRLNEDGQKIAFFLQLTARGEDSPAESFGVAYRLAMTAMRGAAAT